MHYWTEYAIRRTPEKLSSVLDVGIGHCEPAMQLMLMREVKNLVGVEYFGPYAKRKLAGLYDKILLGEAREILPTLPAKSFDLVMAFFILEHLERGEVAQVIGQLEHVGKFVIVTSHNKFFPGSAADGNERQRHKCLVRSREMEERGYKTRGLDFARFPPIWTLTRLFPRLNTDWLAWKAVP